MLTKNKLGRALAVEIERVIALSQKKNVLHRWVNFQIIFNVREKQGPLENICGIFRTWRRGKNWALRAHPSDWLNCASLSATGAGEALLEVEY